GIVIRNKARLVAQGHTKEEGIDYEEVFASVARIEAIRLFLAYASFMGFMVYQMDVKSAFLYETIEEEVYACQPPRFKDPDYPDKVYKVVKALFGLHQAPQAWYETLANYLIENGFQKGKIDQTLFIKKQRGDTLLMSSMGELIFLLGLQVKQSDDGIFISQDKYVAKILRKFGLTDGKSASNPIDTEKPLLKDPDDEDVDTVVATSSTKAEYIAAASCYAQVLWIQNQLLDYGHFITTISIVNDVWSDERCCSLNATRLQFWASVLVKKTHDVVKLQALIDRKKVIITEDTIRQALRLDDADGVDCLPNEDIFAELARIGYKKPPPKNVDSPSKFLMYLWILQVMINAQVDDLSSHNTKYTSPALTQNFFANMMRIGKGFSRVKTPLFDTMLVQPQVKDAAEVGAEDEDDNEKVAHLEHDKVAQELEIVKLKQRVNKLKKKRRSKSFGLKRLRKVGTLQRVESSNDTIVDAQEDASKLKENRRLEEKKDATAVKEVNAAKPTVFDDEEMDKRLQDEEIEQAAAREKQEKEDLERAKVLQQQYDQKQENIDWNIVVEQMQEKHLDNIKIYQSLKMKPIFIAQARKNMIVYLKNMAGYKIQHFKGMTYDQRQCSKKVFKKLRAEVEVSGSLFTQQDTLTVDLAEMSKENVQNMLQIIPIDEFKVEALQVKYPLID
nr:putative ribonuclease H-like domain-containing protein [Tanacetum cinerariifolium]